MLVPLYVYLQDKAGKVLQQGTIPFTAGSSGASTSRQRVAMQPSCPREVLHLHGIKKDSQGRDLDRHYYRDKKIGDPDVLQVEHTRQYRRLMCLADLVAMNDLGGLSKFSVKVHAYLTCHDPQELLDGLLFCIVRNSVSMWLIGQTLLHLAYRHMDHGAALEESYEKKLSSGTQTKRMTSTWINKDPIEAPYFALVCIAL